MASVARLLLNGLVLAGDFRDWEFVARTESPETTLRRIEADWTALGREPTIGEVVWFVATPKGVALVADVKTKSDGSGGEGDS